MTLLEQIQKEHAAAFTHGGKFHADDVFSAALLLHFNPRLTIQRGNRVPEDFDGIVFDIGRGEYDHHQKDSRIRENQVPYAAFGLLWEALGTEILSPEMAARFDEKFVQPLDLNDNTGEKNELASMIGMFNPVWDDNSGSDAAFLEAVAVAGRILEHKWERFRADERAEQQFAALLAEHRKRIAAEKKAGTMDEKILILSEFFPCQKQLSATEIAFLIFPSNRGGYCVQPVRKENSSNYKYDFPETWLGLEKEALQEATGLSDVSFCHKGGFLLTAETLDDAVAACRISLAGMPKAPVLIHIGTDAIDADDALLRQIPGMEHAVILHKPLPEAPEKAGSMPRKSPRVSSPKAVALPSLSISLAAYSVTGMDILNSSSPSAPGSGNAENISAAAAALSVTVAERTSPKRSEAKPPRSFPPTTHSAAIHAHAPALHGKDIITPP